MAEKSSHLTDSLLEDVEAASGDDKSSPSLSTYGRILRKMRRVLFRTLTRKPVIVGAFICFFLFAAFRTSNLTDYSAWSSTAVFSCPSNRTNPHHVVAPKPLEPVYNSNLWQTLLKIYNDHPPSPKHIDQPKHKDGFPTKDKLDSFFTLTMEEANATRKTHEEVMTSLPPYPRGKFSGRGVVMLAGGRYSEFAATSLGMLREVGSKLPVEVWARDTAEEMPGWCEELEREGMACRRLSDHMDMKVFKHPYQWKVFTLIFSSFEETLFLDADDSPIRNPDTIFDSETYQQNGVILWPDYWKHSGSPWCPYLIGISDQKSDMLADAKSVESGQIVWNKKTHWKSLLLAAYYNYYGPDFYFTVFNNGWAGWGDKDTFPMALKATGESYYQIQHNIITVFVTGTLLGIGMVQADPANETLHQPMFLHSNIVKWSMRNFLCVGCSDIPGHKPIYHLEKPDSPVNKHLREGIRIFGTDQLFQAGLDPEPTMWKAVEHTACRSAAWGNETLCQQARSHMERTFKFKFQESRIASATGYGDKICVVDPPPQNFTNVQH